MDNLAARVERMSKLGAMFVTVTWGAGGSSAEKSLAIAAMFQQDLGVTTCLHLTCTNMEPKLLDDALEKAKTYGIKNILALRGDPPRDLEYRDPSDTANQFVHAVDLVKYIKAKYGDYFCVGVAAYPEGHYNGIDAPPQSPEFDMPYLKEKIDAGGEFIITQLCYDSEKFLQFDKLIKADDKLKNVPLIAGLMPINMFQSFLRASKLSHASVPDELMEKLRAVPTGDDNAVKQVGVDVLTDIINVLGQHTGVKGFHFYTLNLEKSVALILEKSGLLAKPTAPSYDESSAIADDDDEDSTGHVIAPPADGKPAGRRKSSVNNYVIVDKPRPGDDAVSASEAGSTEGVLPDSERIAISRGEGDLGRQATWDDFPNGRFGDSRSPAFGEIDGYGPTLHVEPSQAYKLWGFPVDIKDVIKLFARHITNDLDALPFSDQGLSAETGLIQEQLLNMIHKGMLTVASQPAVNGTKSTDKMFGWGPPGGHVFQKAFVEFFVSDDEWQTLKDKLNKAGPEVTYYEGTSAKEANFSTNLPAGSSNAVTWGVFPNREILQSTIIEEESFMAWRDEAFAVWKEWRHLYKPGTPSYKLLDDIYNKFHLVSVVHHDFHNENALWELLES